MTVSTTDVAGWSPREGRRLDYLVDIRFGEEPSTMPSGWRMGRVSAVAVSADGDVYVLHRGKAADPVLVFDRDGSFLRSWGRGQLEIPHGLRVDPEGCVWTTDIDTHQVIKYSPSGDVLLTLGIAGVSGDDEQHFNMPTDIAFGEGGAIYVSDGYGNSRIRVFRPDGTSHFTWGSRGSRPGEFNAPHSMAFDSQGLLYVSDRENNRIQVFASDGSFVRQWNHLGATQGISITDDEIWIITHRDNQENIAYDTLAGRIMRVQGPDGSIVGSIGSPGHWIHRSLTGEIFVASLTGNVFRWRPGWVEEGAAEF